MKANSSIILLVSVVLTGCRGTHHHPVSTTTPTPPSTVSVGGVVENPGSHKISASVGTLGDALTLAVPQSEPDFVAPSVRSGDQLAIGITQDLLDELDELAAVATRIHDASPGVTVSARTTDAPEDHKRFAALAFSILKNRETLQRRAQSPAVKTKTGGLSQDAKRGPLVEYNDARNDFESEANAEHLTKFLDAIKKLKEEFREILTILRRQAAVSNVDVSLDATGAELLVQLRRVEDGRPGSHFFPLAYVQSGPAGAIPLRHGDYIFVKRIRQTDLRNDFDGTNGLVTVAGFVKKPGNYPRTEFPNLAYIQSQIDSRVVASQSSTIVKRTSASGEPEVYVLPYDTVSGSDTYGPIATHSGDSIQVIPSEWAPLVGKVVFNSRFAASRVGRIEGRSPILDHHQRKILHLADHKGRTKRAIHDLLSRH